MKSNFGIVLYEAQCTNDCVFCGSKKMGDIKNNIKMELAKIDQAREKGQRIEQVEISGQDPGEYVNLPEFVVQVKAASGAREIILITNGKKLADKKFLKKVIASGVNHFIIPFYGHNAKIHEKITQSVGSFRQTGQGLKNLYDLHQRVSFQCLITKENQEHLGNLVLFLSQLPFYDFCRLGVPCYKKNNKKFRESMPDFTKLKDQLSDALDLCRQINFNLQLFDMPRCLINFHYENMVENKIPTKAYENLKGNKFHDFKIAGGQVVPEYRLKKKEKKCQRCIYSKKCEGFFANYIDLGYFRCQPVFKMKK